MSALAGIASSLVLAMTHHRSSTIVWLAFIGSFLGTPIWVLKKVLGIQKGWEVAGTW
jgi:hypothetical protein